MLLHSYSSVTFTNCQMFIFLLALTASSQAQVFTPIHGCEWVPQTTAVTNFTLFHSASNDSTPDYVDWQAPALRVSCHASNPSTTGTTTAIGDPGTSTTVDCTASGSDPTKGTLLVSADDGSGSNATLKFMAYAQCAADIYAFYYEANFLLSCASDAWGSTTCVSKGNATASLTSELYLPPIHPPPPPPRGM